MCSTKWYQIQLFKKGKIEIFQNVFHHRTSVEEGETYIEIHHSRIHNIGLKTLSTRKISDCYDVKIINEPDYELKTEFPKDIEIVIHSTRRKEVENGGLR
jgi:hypothetical protein